MNNGKSNDKSEEKNTGKNLPDPEKEGKAPSSTGGTGDVKEVFDNTVPNYIRNIKVLRGTVVCSLIMGFISAAVGILLIQIYYFNLLYKLLENRIVEFADPLIGPITMPIYTVITGGGATAFISSIVMLVLMRHPERHPKATVVTGYIVGIADIVNLIYAAVPGLFIIYYLHLGRKFEVKGVTPSSEKYFAENPDSPLYGMPAALVWTAVYMAIVGTTLTSMYHIVIILPYEHLGVEYAPSIKAVWTILPFFNGYWFVTAVLTAIYAYFLANLPYMDKEEKIKAEKVMIPLKKTLTVLHFFWLPVGPLIAMHIRRTGPATHRLEEPSAEKTQ